MSDPPVRIIVLENQKGYKMIDFKELGFNSEDEMLDFIESQRDSEIGRAHV